MTIKYLNPVRYGIWITVSSVISWMTLFDVGLGNGLRNKFAQSLALGDEKLAKIYVSTSYVLLTLIVITIYIPFAFLNGLFDWTKLLNTSSGMKGELNKLVFIVFTFFCIQFILKLLTTILIAYQKPAFSDFINFLTNIISLIIIYLLTAFTSGSLLYLGAAFSGVPIVVLLIFSFWSYWGRLKMFRPNFRYVDFRYAKELYSLGIKFFIIQISAVVIYSTDSVIISNILGPAEVTPYNIAFKYFSIISVAFGIIMVPMWSGVTDAYTRGDIDWIKKSIRRNLFIWVAFAVITMIMIIISNPIYKIWIGNAISIPFKLTVLMGLYVISNTFMLPFVFFINGIGKIKLQFLISIATGILNIPISILFAGFLHIGSAGVILGTIVTLTPFLILMPLQYNKIINQKAYNIWNA
jgi:O-antigen/teichoic acid export membrane protein